jgi:hypothetical protein
MTPCLKINGAIDPPLKFSGMNAVFLHFMQKFFTLIQNLSFFFLQMMDLKKTTTTKWLQKMHCLFISQTYYFYMYLCFKTDHLKDAWGLCNFNIIEKLLFFQRMCIKMHFIKKTWKWYGLISHNLPSRWEGIHFLKKICGDEIVFFKHN